MGFEANTWYLFDSNVAVFSVTTLLYFHVF